MVGCSPPSYLAPVLMNIRDSYLQFLMDCKFLDQGVYGNGICNPDMIMRLYHNTSPRMLAKIWVLWVPQYAVPSRKRPSNMWIEYLLQYMQWFQLGTLLFDIYTALGSGSQHIDRDRNSPINERTNKRKLEPDEEPKIHRLNSRQTFTA